MAGVLFVCEGAVARRCRCHRTRPCVFVCCAFYCCCCCCCCCCSCTRVFVVWLVWICKVWFSSCPGSESLPLCLQQSEFRGGQSPNHIPPIFHRHPCHLGGVFSVSYTHLRAHETGSRALLLAQQCASDYTADSSPTQQHFCCRLFLNRVGG